MKRFEHVIVGTQPQRLNGALQRAVRRDDYHFGRQALLPNIAQHVQAVHHRHHQVERRHTVLAVFQHRQGLRPVRGRLNLIAQRGQTDPQQTVHLRLVVDRQNALARIHSDSLVGG